MPEISAVSRACETTSPISSAFCSPVEQSSAGMSLAEWRTSRSARCGPSRVRPAARSRLRPDASAARSVSSTSTAGRSPTCCSTAPSSAIEARGNGPSSGSLAIIADKQPHELAARRGDRHAGFGHLRLDGVEPGPVARILGKQAVASAHRLFVVERPPPVVGVDGQHQPVEEAAAVAGRPAEQRVHGRRHPRHAQDLEHVLGRARVGAVDADAAARLDAGCDAGRAGADLGVAVGTGSRVHARRSRPPRRGGRCRRRRRVSARGPATGRKQLRADWSCRRRSRR